MNLTQRIWHVATVIILLSFLLSARLVYWQLVRADELQPVILNPIRSATPSDERLLKEVGPETLAEMENLPPPVRQRLAELLGNITRGAIYDRNGRPLAYDVAGEGGARTRFYAEPSVAPLLGYVSSFGLGVAGVEATYNETLLGLDRLDSQLSRLLHQPVTGNDLYLTVDSRVQRAASEGLAGRPGAVVVLDADNGAILALASSPTFDPNRILDRDYFASLLNCATAECRDALLNRATQGLYTPGSTWKTVTLITALDSGQVTPQTVFDFGEPRQGPNGIYYVYEVDGAVIVDPNHAESRLDLVGAYVKSANAAFARLGDEMPPQTMVEYATRLGFGAEAEPLPLRIPVATTQIANEIDALLNNNVLQAATGFGQGELLVTPLHMALMVSAVVNEGNIPRPHLLLRVQAPSGDVRQQAEPEFWLVGAMRPETAQQVADIMVTAAQRLGIGGSGGITVGGKTGTAQLGGDQRPHAWYIGFARKGERTVVIAVVVEHGGSGASVALPIFSQVADAALNHLGEPVEEVVPPPR
jgi:peptidoglycan glycosyltransferase